MKVKFSKRLFTCILVLLLIPAFLLTLFAGCTDPEEEQEEPVTYTVTVVGGTIDGTSGAASGEYEAGESVTVVADTAPSGQEFVRWTVGGREVSSSASYTFTVDGDITVTAEFANVYAVTVVGGTIKDTDGSASGTYVSGALVTVVADPQTGKRFDCWVVDGQEVSESSEYTFTVEKAVTLTAQYVNTFTVTVQGGTVTDGTSPASASGVFDEGAEVTISATVPSGKRFTGWEVNGQASTQTAASYKTTVGSDMTVVAKFVNVYQVTVQGGTIQGGDTSGVYDEGKEVTVIANDPAPNTRFAGWKVNGSDTIVGTEKSYSFTVQANTTVTAVFVATYTVTVENGTIQGGGTSGSYEEGTQVTVVADTAPSGQEFYRWTSDGKAVSSENPYTFTVEGNVTLKAEYYTPVTEGTELNIEKSVGGNPIGGFGIGDETFDSSWTTGSTAWQEGDSAYADVLTYGGDPAVMVTKDPDTGVETAYLYVGHDVTTAAVTSTYTMPEWICYSSTDLIHWKTEGIIMDIEDIPWARGQAAGNVEPSAWASQVIEYKGYYWFLFCSWSENTAGYSTAGNNGHMCIGLAVSDDPTGPFECYNEPLVFSNQTNVTEDGKNLNDAGWNDIDPTAWVTSEGEMYVAWGNTNSFMCQVEMVETADNGTRYPVELEIVDQSVKHETGKIVTTDDPVFYQYGYADIEKVADIMQIDLWRQNTANNTFTEAPYLYARDTDGDGAEDRYYMFYAAGWREALAYSYVDVDNPDGLWEDVWNYGNRLMDPTATSNTNHPAVFDFGGKTYMIYHNGSLPYGCGYRRVANIAELEFSDSGFINFVAENSTGLDGVNSKITQDDIPIGHLYTVNSHNDMYYPINLPTFWKAASAFENEDDALWEIEAAKYVPAGMNADSYVSIQAYNMAGLYLTYDIATGKVVITQDDERDGTPESDALQARMSFKTLAGANGVGVMFQCVADEDFYLAIVGGELVVTDSATAAQRTFRVQTQTANRSATYTYNEGVAIA